MKARVLVSFPGVCVCMRAWYLTLNVSETWRPGKRKQRREKKSQGGRV